MSDYLAKRIKAERQLAKMTQAELAEEMGCTQDLISKWERGCFSPTVFYIEKLCEVFHVTPNSLLGWEVRHAYD